MVSREIPEPLPFLGKQEKRMWVNWLTILRMAEKRVNRLRTYYQHSDDLIWMVTLTAIFISLCLFLIRIAP